MKLSKLNNYRVFPSRISSNRAVFSKIFNFRYFIHWCLLKHSKYRRARIFSVKRQWALVYINYWRRKGSMSVYCLSYVNILSTFICRLTAMRSSFRLRIYIVIIIFFPRRAQFCMCYLLCILSTRFSPDFLISIYVVCLFVFFIFFYHENVFYWDELGGGKWKFVLIPIALATDNFGTTYLQLARLAFVFVAKYLEWKQYAKLKLSGVRSYCVTLTWFENN